MLFRPVAPLRRKGTQNYSFRQRIPADLRERMAGMSLVVPIGPKTARCNITAKTETLRISLRTAIPSEVRQRQGELAAYFEALFASLRSSKPIALSHQQCVALAGAMFRNWASTERGRTTAVESDTLKPGTAWRVVDDPFELPGAWQAALNQLPAPEEVIDPLEELEPLFGRLVDHALRDRGLTEIDKPSRALALREFLRALRDGLEVQKRQAAGDFSPPPEAVRFPEWVAPKPVVVVDPPKPTGKASDKVSLKGLHGRWWAEAKIAGRSQSTHDSYQASINRFATFLKHDDPQRVTNADVVRFKDHRIASGASLKTVRDSDLVGLKALFNYAVANGLMASNPADGVKVLRSKKTQTRPKGFTIEEAEAILRKSLRHVRTPTEKPQTAAAKRWVPWLCAYTGARVGEVVQLRKEDVKQNGEWWTITITPEAGTVKDKEVREVVLHAHLVEQGFPDFVQASKPGHLFYAVKGDEDPRGKWKAVKNRLAAFAREVVPDERVAPNHGWRHAFKTRGREVGIEDSVLDAIGGWAPSTVGGRYGDVSLAAQVKAFEKFPRFKAED
ncbi:hypothetical protein GCM10011390_48660 [Aureimonas endophytica]|uniref:Site-specific recombinase XerD n=1 Tax=Aureimonas endophytica TaxID=2027858 RepID=A0A917A4S9_9HYPH|nr:DUF6538 domain-containing protein [Aureimonas endophytica]GGE23512.1 hypothetical protein GCM10011390_48660 [Aureimonas endophytica]